MEYVDDNLLETMKLTNFGVKFLEQDDYDVYFSWKVDLDSDFDIQNDGNGDVVLHISFQDKEGYEVESISFYVKIMANIKTHFTEGGNSMTKAKWEMIDSCHYYCVQI